MAIRGNQAQGSTGPLQSNGTTIRRGLSQSKNRDKALLSQSQQKPPQDAGEDQNANTGENNNGAATNTMNQTKNLLTKRQKKPAYLQSLNEHEKAENFKIIDNMSKKISYLKNPRFQVNKSPIIMTHAGKDEVNDAKNPFRVEPKVVQFVDYQVNGVYEIPVKVTNASGISRRIKFIPPTSDNFTVRNIKYPSKDTGDVAPGMSIILNISFCAPSFADFDDFITFVTDENSFKIPLRARRDPPVISLVNPLDCLHSWLGDRVDMAFRCQNTGGDGGFKFFCERDEDDQKQVDGESIKIGAFTLTPAVFYLYSGNAIDIYVSFAPEEEGQQQENLILACDNQTSEFYKLTGYGAKLDLDILAVDGKDVDYKKNPFSTLFFENTNPTSESKRVVRIQNSSPILVPFHWSLYKTKNTNKISLSHEETHYRIEPNQGKIQGGQFVDFTIYFCPQHAEPYYEFADLIVEDIPIQSIRNAPDGLKSFAANNVQKNLKCPMPTYVGSNTQFLSIPIISFNMRGQGNSCKVELSPPILFFEEDNFINHVYTQKIFLLKAYEGSVKYKLRMEGKNSDAFLVNLKAQGQQLDQIGGVIEGQIKNENSIELEVQVSSSEVGEKMAYFFIEIEDGEPVTFQCKANFRGPTLKLIEPIVDYSLVKINTSQNYRINIENTSPIVAEILIKNSKNKRLTFQNMNNFTEDDPSSDSGDQSINRFKTTNGNGIWVDEIYKCLKPFEKREILLTLECIKTEFVEEYFEIMVKDSDSQFFQVRADVQKPRVTLNRNVIELGRIYAGITEVIDYDHKQAIVLKNFGNIPAQFCWEEKIDSEKIIARFEPSRGSIPPKSEVQIYFSSTVYFGGAVDELFICEIDDLEIPLGFELHADAFGLNVCYEATDDNSQSLSLSPAGKSVSSQSINIDNKSEQPYSMLSGVTSITARRQQKLANQQQDANKLKMLNFPGCTINKSSSQKFILKNLSGIKTSFKFSSYNFEPISHVAPQQKSEIQLAQEEQKRVSQQMSDSLQSSPDSKMGGSPFKGSKQIRFAPSAKSGGGTSTGFGKTGYGKNTQQQSAQKFSRAILSDEHEQTQKFSSATGETFTATKKLDKEQTFFLSNNKGIAVVFTPHMGDLPPHSEIPVTVTIYNNVCGKFDDKIISEIKGLPPVEFPVIIGISGSPVVIPANQVGLNYKTFPPTLPMPTIVTNSQPIFKTFKIKNTGIRAVEVNWKIFDQKDLDVKDTDFFTLSVAKNFSFDRKENPFKFNFQAVEPEESQNSAFEIEPKVMTISPRQTQQFKVTFYSDKGIGEFKSIILASPELSSQELEVVDPADDLHKKGSLGIISLNLLANAIQPKLTIDKKHSVDGDTHLKFKYWSVPEEDAPSAIKKIIYTNDTMADLTFNLNVNGPFEIVKTKSNTGAKHPLESQQTPSKLLKKKVQTMFCIQPLKIVEIHVKFLTPPPSTTEDWPLTIKNEREGELIAYFANGEQQRLALDGLLMRPKLELLTEKISKNDQALDELDFNIVNVDKFRTIKVFLSNITHVTAKWALNYVKFPKKSTIGYNTTTPWEEENLKKTDDPDVFEFSLTQGALKGKSLPLRKIPEGLSIPPVPKDDYEKQFLPQTIQINFRPKANVLYKSKFRFTVENGISCDVILKGKGSYEEQHD